MNDDDHRISPLDTRSRVKLVSSVRISSLNEVVIELIKNALDARAKRIELSLNYVTGFCSVSDNGWGIPANEFFENGKLAQEYCTSKTTTTGTYGRFGQTLFRIAGVALLCIISKAAQADGAHALWCDEAGRIGRDTRCSEDVQTCIGTTVKVYNLFSKLPVRSRHISQVFANQYEVRKDFDRLRQSVLELVLGGGFPVEIDITHSSPALRYHHRPTAARSLGSVHPRRNIESVRSCLRQADYAYEQSNADWREITVRSGSIHGFAIISTIPLPHRKLQFINIDNKALSKKTRPELFLRINSFFSSSKFGDPDFNMNVTFEGQNAGTDHHDRVKQRSRKSIDQWPMFVVWLEDIDDIGLDEVLYSSLLTSTTESIVDRIAKFLELMVSEFLRETGFLDAHMGLQKPQAAIDHSSQAYDFLEQASKQNFSHFSRSKSSAQTGNVDILNGLPFQSGKRRESDILQDTVRLEELVDTDQPDIYEVNDEFSPAPRNANDQQSIQWLDPRTGRYSNIDLRTGMVLPDVVQVHTYGPGGNSATSRKQTRARRADRDIIETAQNVRKHFDDKTGSSNAPIRSTFLEEPTAQNCNSQIMPLNEHKFDYRQGVLPACSHESARVTKEALGRATLSKQVDKKFILTVVSTDEPEDIRQRRQGDCLVLIDQHAADERCRVEQLLRSMQYGDPVYLQEPIHCELPEGEVHRLDHINHTLAKWQVIVETAKGRFSSDTGEKMQQVQIRGLPEAIAERCRLNPRLAIDLLREAIWSEDAVQSRHHKDLGLIPLKLPLRILDMINSRACRSAIMFNDRLDDDQCQDLLHRLSKCVLPFQCAHGRPSMIVVANMQATADCGSLESVSQREHRNGLGTVIPDRYGLNTIDDYRTPSFGEAYRLWTEGDVW